MTAIDDMLRRFSVMYGEPKTPDYVAFIEEYRNALAGYSEDAIKRAADMLIREQDVPFWPTPGKCRAKAVEAAAKIAVERRVASDIPADEPPAPRTVKARETPIDIQAGILKLKHKTSQQAAEFQKLGSVMPNVNRTYFEARQQDSSNPHLHMTPKAYAEFCASNPPPIEFPDDLPSTTETDHADSDR